VTCVHLNILCTNPAAPTNGARVHHSVCAICQHYEGPPRGLGDRVHTVLGAIGVHKVVRNCGGCAERRAALNKALPETD
jgi:hypothetical protein